MVTNVTQRLYSIAIAASLTLAMLAGIDALATSQPSPALLAHIAAAQQS
jgi:hypothetical protein